MVGGCKNVAPKESPYTNHSWCSNCQEWQINRPLKCNNCNRRCRMNVRFSGGIGK